MSTVVGKFVKIAQSRGGSHADAFVLCRVCGSPTGLRLVDGSFRCRGTCRPVYDERDYER